MAEGRVTESGAIMTPATGVDIGQLAFLEAVRAVQDGLRLVNENLRDLNQKVSSSHDDIVALKSQNTEKSLERLERHIDNQHDKLCQQIERWRDELNKRITDVDNDLQAFKDKSLEDRRNLAIAVSQIKTQLIPLGILGGAIISAIVAVVATKVF